MKIVIDIPDEIYNHTQKYEVGGFNIENDTKLFLAIKNGTPLPKRHGRLIDADALTSKIILTDDEILDVILKENINDAPTIVEADKKESD